jgi:hypothetical protein
MQRGSAVGVRPRNSLLDEEKRRMASNSTSRVGADRESALAIHWVANGGRLSTLEIDRHLELVTGIVNLVVGCLPILKFELIGRKIFGASSPTSESLQPEDAGAGR